jgi:hypothetical protein
MKQRSTVVRTIDFDDLTDEERRLVVHFVELLRRTRGKREALSEFGGLLEKLAQRPDAMTQEEAEALALEAQRAVRRASS